ncbi:Zinc-binding oxidoreductase alcohol dehydrogenase [Microbotryomycetes sp. JL201]|nr:Zinc-binding oxidoreductase alcohol dehydrogenase [Microbotryomycetes sp. JL201]
MSKTMRALVSSGKGQASIQSIAVPSISDRDVLVKIKAVALNPTDWKHRDFVGIPNSVLGCDFAGEVVEKGSSVSNVAIGDRVAGFVHGGKANGVGSFAEYTKIGSTLVWKVPDNVSDEEAAALGGIGPHTASQALFSRLHLNQPDSPTSESKPVLVWGGSSSVGLYAIQLATLAGYKVVATSSPKNFDLLKSFGAEATYSYADDDTPAKIAKDYPDLSTALDTISENGTTLKVAKSFASGKGHIVTLLPVRDEQLSALKPDIVAEGTLVYSVLGDAYETPLPSPPPQKLAEDKKFIEDWSVKVSKWIADGKFKSNPLWSQPGGLDGVQDALDLLKQGKNSAQKLTLRL